MQPAEYVRKIQGKEHHTSVLSITATFEKEPALSDPPFQYHINWSTAFTKKQCGCCISHKWYCLLTLNVLSWTKLRNRAHYPWCNMASFPKWCLWWTSLPALQLCLCEKSVVSAHPALLWHHPRLPARHASWCCGHSRWYVGGWERVEGLHRGLLGLVVSHALPSLHQSLCRLLKGSSGI